MSAEINNSEYRKKVIAQLIKRLHDGEPVDEVKKTFKKEFDGVGADEIAQAEKELMASGVPLEEVQRLCDVHASLFEGSVAEIHGLGTKAGRPVGHPVWVLEKENEALMDLLSTIDATVAKATADQANAITELGRLMDSLLDIKKHYGKKENLWFPRMEQHGITAPPKVMWGVDDEIRAQIKTVRDAIASPLPASWTADYQAVRQRIVDMVSKEENILTPMVSGVFTDDDWNLIAEGTEEIGFFLIDGRPALFYAAQRAPVRHHAREEKSQTVQMESRPTLPTEGTITLATGTFDAKTLQAVLNTLPVDITFVDASDTVRYFSQGKERVFPRTTAILGRQVVNCHPPASMHVVQQILDDFRAGNREEADFYIHLKDKYIYIRYYAVRDEKGVFLGTLEVTQDIAAIQQLTGDKRLLS